MNKYEFKNEGKKVELKIYGEIGDYWNEEGDDSVHSLKDLEEQLKENKDASIIDIYINSEGGSVFDGVAIYNMLKRTRAYKRVFIEGFACSIASVIAMAGNVVVMPKSSMMMIHNAWTIAMGNSKELRKVAEDLEKINEAIRNAYMNKFNGGEDLLIQLMDEESYLTAEECFNYGLCTKLGDEIDEESVNESLTQYEHLYENKLKTLTALKNAIKEIDADAESVTEVEISEEEIETTEDKAEEEHIEEPVEEVKETEEVKKTEVKETVEAVKENALRKFFNMKGDSNE